MGTQFTYYRSLSQIINRAFEYLVNYKKNVSLCMPDNCNSIMDKIFEQFTGTKP